MWMENDLQIIDSCHWKCLYFEDFSVCSIVLGVNMDVTLDLHSTEQSDLGFIQTYILLPALGLQHEQQC